MTRPGNSTERTKLPASVRIVRSPKMRCTGFGTNTLPSASRCARWSPFARRYRRGPVIVPFMGPRIGDDQSTQRRQIGTPNVVDLRKHRQNCTKQKARQAGREWRLHQRRNSAVTPSVAGPYRR